MTAVDEPARPATRRDREVAIRQVESAWAAGQIVEADRDLRVDQLRRAETLGEIRLVVHGLRAPSYDPVPAASPGSPARPESGAPSRPAVARSRFPVGVAIGALVVMLVAVGGLVSAIGGDDDVATATVEPSGEPAEGEVDLFGRDDFRDLLADLEDGIGGTELFQAVLYPTYASLDVPVDDRTHRKQSYYWDGDLDEPGSKGTSDDPRFDLAAIDHAVVVDLVGQVRRRVEDPTSWYAIVHAPDEDDGAVFQVYASNEYGESAYVSATADGTVVYRSDPSP
ncbi:MAG TPA: hypothetical protein VMF51_14415 [Nocardioides sp.]|uniref:hypothetical protein n=1 Tax=Nocardioides sp. TaxID=35761 RepID=UPI002B59AE2F|nr:hypothetical protein [Nocardioides sp.]HTW16325.1 hypothetical protein [Nocardioides sp.]